MYAVLNIPCTHVFAVCDTLEEAEALTATDPGLWPYKLSEREADALRTEGVSEGVLA